MDHTGTYLGALRGYEWSREARSFADDLQQRALRKLLISDNRLSRLDESVALEIAEARVDDFGGDIDAALAAGRKETTNPDLPTPFEVPVWYNMLLDYSDEIAAAAAEAGKPLAFRPMLATLPSGHVNAVTALVPDTRDQYVILFEAGLFGFLNLVSKCVASVLLTTARLGDLIELDLDKPWRVSREDVSRFFDVYGAYIVAGNPMYASRYLPSRDLLPIHHTLLQGAEYFVLGHELGHVIEGHFDQGRQVAQVYPGISIEQLPSTWREELDADANGFELMLAVARRKQFTAELAYAGAEMFFTAIELLEYALLAIESGTEWRKVVQQKYDRLRDSLLRPTPETNLGSHPPPAMRRDYLRQLAGTTPPAETARRANLLAERVTEIMNAVWVETAPLFERLHADGVRPAAVWGE